MSEERGFYGCPNCANLRGYIAQRQEEAGRELAAARSIAEACKWVERLDALREIATALEAGQ